MLILIVGLKIRLYKWKVFSLFAFISTYSHRDCLLLKLFNITQYIVFISIVLPVMLRYGILSERMCVHVSAYVHLKSLALMPPHAIQVSNNFRSVLFSRNVSFLLFCHLYLPGYLHRIAYALQNQFAHLVNANEVTFTWEIFYRRWKCMSHL